MRKSRCSSKRRRFDSNKRSALSASHVSTPAALKRTTRPFCCRTMRRPSATSSSARRRSFLESIFPNNAQAAKRVQDLSPEKGWPKPLCRRRVSARSSCLGEKPIRTEAPRNDGIQLHEHRGNTPGYSLLCSCCDRRATRFNKVAIAARKRFAGHKKELQGRQVEGKGGEVHAAESRSVLIVSHHPIVAKAYSPARNPAGRFGYEGLGGLTLRRGRLQ